MSRCEIIAIEGTVHSGKTRLSGELLKRGLTVSREDDKIPGFSLRLENKRFEEIGIANYLRYQKEHIDVCLRMHSQLASNFDGTIIVDRDLLSALMFVKWRLPGFYEVTRNYLLSQIADREVNVKFRIAFLSPYLANGLKPEQDHRIVGDLSLESITGQLKALIAVMEDKLVDKLLIQKYYHNPEMRVFTNHETIVEDFIKWVKEG